MINPRALLNQPIKGHLVPSELISRRDESFTFKAKDTRSQQTVILKFYPLIESKILQDELTQALRFQASHRDPRFVPVLDFGPHPSGGHWITTEQQTTRVSLLKYVRSRERGKLSPAEAAVILGALCDSLSALHGEGLYHGNLKPTNVFLEERGDPSSVRLSDAVGSSLCGVHKTDEGRITFNDPTFFSYEQASGKGATAHSDLCALGLMGYFMLTGRFPFEGRTTDKLLAAVIIGSGRLKLEPAELEGEAGAEGEALISLLERCYAKSTAKRPTSVSDLKAKLMTLGAAPQGAEALELSAGPQTISLGDAGAHFGARGPQTLMYQSIDDESLSMLEEARAEFSAMYGSEQPNSGAPQPYQGDEDAHMAELSGDFKTLMGVSIDPELLVQAERFDTTPPEAPPLSDSEEMDFNFDLDALSRSMEEPLLSGSGEPNTYLEPNTYEPNTYLEPSTSIEHQTLISTGSPRGGGEQRPPSEPSPPSSYEHEEAPYFEMHTTSSPSLELPFMTPSPDPFPNEELDQHVELFSEPARILPPEPEEPSVTPASTAYEPATSPSQTLLSSPYTQSQSFDTYLEGLSVASLFPQLPAWQELMSLKDQPEALTEALTRIKVPLTGHLLPFSQFQLQLEGHRYEEPFFDEPVEQLSLEVLLPPPSAREQGALSGYTADSFDEFAPSVISAVIEGSQASSQARGPSPRRARAALIALLVALVAGGYLLASREPTQLNTTELNTTEANGPATMPPSAQPSPRQQLSAPLPEAPPQGGSIKSSPDATPSSRVAAPSGASPDQGPALLGGAAARGPEGGDPSSDKKKIDRPLKVTAPAPDQREAQGGTRGRAQKPATQPKSKARRASKKRRSKKRKTKSVPGLKSVF